MNIPKVVWKYHLVKSSTMGLISNLTAGAHNKQLQLMLNQAGTNSYWMHLEDDRTKYIEELDTAMLLYRNNKPIWSGPIFKCLENAENTQSNNQLSVTAMGWFELLNYREVHTGFEWKEMAIKASGREIIRYPTLEHEKELEEIEKQYNEVVSEGFYTPVATESAQQLFYANTPMAEIANDLIIRANIDYPTGITIGEVAPTNSINSTVQQFQNVGEQITKLTAIESGFDFEIDPLTKKFNTYRNEITAGIAGKGVNRGERVRFTYPGNCVSANRSTDATKMRNRVEAIGEYAIGKEESVQSINEYKTLFETSDSLPEVVILNYLNAYAAAEVIALEKPFRVLTFNPRSVTNSESYSVPRPFEDYEIGDIVYAKVIKGPRFRVGVEHLQQVRLFGATINVSDTGVESVTGLQTIYSQG